jgi:hypothetical protein
MQNRWWVLAGLGAVAAVAALAHGAALVTALQPPGKGESGLLGGALIGLPVLLLLNGTLALWRWRGRFVLGPFLLLGVTLPTVGLAGLLTLLSLVSILSPQGIGWLALIYLVLPIEWAVAVLVGGLAGAGLDWALAGPSGGGIRLRFAVLLGVLAFVPLVAHALAGWAEFRFHSDPFWGLLLLLAGVLLAALLALNAAAASWRRGVAFVLGPFLLAGLTAPTLVLAGFLTATALVTLGGDAPDLVEPYTIWPLFWLVGLAAGALAGAWLDRRNAASEGPSEPE